MRFTALAALAVALVLASERGVSQAIAHIVADRDNTLYQSSSGSLSNGSGPAFFCGVTGTGSKRRGLIHFDVAGNIPASATILAATVTLEMNQTSAGPLQIDLRRMLASWGEGASAPSSGNGGSGAPAAANDATWQHRFYPSQYWAVAGGDFSAAASASTSVWQGGFYNWSSAQLTADVQNFLDSPATNFGWMLKSPETQVGDAKRFTSREEVFSAGWPRLVVTYVALPSASTANLGFGCNGQTLVPLGLPKVGNAGFGLSIGGAAPGGSAYVIPSASIAVAPLSLGGGCWFDLDVASAIAFIDGGYAFGPILVNGAGAALFSAPIPPSGPLHGFSVALQGVVLGNTVSSTNVFSVVLGS